MEALRCPPDDADVSHAVGGREAARRALPGCCSSTRTCCCSTSPPTTSTRSRSSGWSASSRSTPGTVVAVTHDRYFLDNVAKWILELDRGRGIPFSGNYSGWLEQKLERMAREQKQADARQRTLARELEWVRMGARARQAKGKARLSAYERLLAEANDAKSDRAGAGDRDPARTTPG